MTPADCCQLVISEQHVTLVVLYKWLIVRIWCYSLLYIGRLFLHCSRNRINWNNQINELFVDLNESSNHAQSHSNNLLLHCPLVSTCWHPVWECSDWLDWFIPDHCGDSGGLQNALFHVYSGKKERAALWFNSAPVHRPQTTSCLSVLSLVISQGTLYFFHLQKKTHTRTEIDTLC